MIYIYKFILLRIYDFKNKKPLYDRYSQIHLNLYWRINRISLVRINPSMVLEGFSNNLNLNLESEELEVCGLDPITDILEMVIVKLMLQIPELIQCVPKLLMNFYNILKVKAMI